MKEIQKRKSHQDLLKTEPLHLEVPKSQTGRLFRELSLMVAPCLFSFSRLSLLANITQVPGLGEALIWPSTAIHMFLCIIRVIMLTYHVMGQDFSLSLFLNRYCCITAICFLQTSLNPAHFDLRNSQDYEPEHYKLYLLCKSIIWITQWKLHRSFCIKQAN